MKTRLDLSLSLLGRALFLALSVAQWHNDSVAQTFNVLHSFSNVFVPNVDGGQPNPELILVGDTLYGSASVGGSDGVGTVFSVKADGTGFRTIQNIPTTLGSAPGNLMLAGNTFYGVMEDFGFSAFGAVYSLQMDTGVFTGLHTFPASKNDGRHPFGPLILAGQTLYGTTSDGGPISVGTGSGIVFSLDLATTNLTTLHNFETLHGDTNFEGALPGGGLILAGNRFYGTTSNGGSGGSGTVFALSIDGNQFDLLHAFSANDGKNGDGWQPDGLVLDGNTLYGGTYQGGTNFSGTLYSITTNGTDFQVLHTFSKAKSDGSVPGILGTNWDGNMPNHRLAIANNRLYGVATEGGTEGAGTIFSLNTDGTDFTILHTFDRAKNNTNHDGSAPQANLVVVGTTLYGTTSAGGQNGQGTVFSLMIPSGPPASPSLSPSLIPGSGLLMISWPNSFVGYTLETKTNLVAGSAWEAFTGQVTNSSSQQSAEIRTDRAGALFRLRHP